MSSRRRSYRALAVLAAPLAVSPAAAELPPSVEAMIREAAKADQDTLVAVVRMAKLTNPDDVAAIDTLGGRYLADIRQRNEAAQMAAKEAEIERLSSYGVFEGWRGQGEFGFGYATGNSNQISGLLGLKLSRDGLKARHNFSASLDYQETDNLLSRERYTVNYGLNYLLKDGLYVATLLGWERDRFAGFARRFTESVGLGYRVINRPGITLDIDGGPALRQILFTDGRSEDDIGARGSLAYRWTIKPGMTLSEDASVVSSGDNTTLISASALTAKLTRAISARVSFNLQAETNPLPGRVSTDTATRASFVYSF